MVEFPYKLSKRFTAPERPNVYNQMIALIADVTGAATTVETNRYDRDLAILVAWLANPGRDAEWAYTISTAQLGIAALIKFDFDAAEAAFASVIAQCA